MYLSNKRQRFVVSINHYLTVSAISVFLLACQGIIALPTATAWAQKAPVAGAPSEAGRPGPRTAPEYVEAGRRIPDRDRQIQYFSKAMELDPNSMEAYFWRGIAYEAKKENDKALADFNRALELNPKRAANYIWRAIVYADQKAYDQAIADLNQALILEPRYGWAYYHRGRVRVLQGNLEQALDDLDWAVTIDLFNSQAFFERGKIHLKKKNYDIAISDFSKVIGVESKNYEAYLLRAQAYQALGEAAKAQEDLLKSNELKPQVKGK